MPQTLSEVLRISTESDFSMTRRCSTATGITGGISGATSEVNRDVIDFLRAVVEFEKGQIYANCTISEQLTEPGKGGVVSQMNEVTFTIQES